MSTLDREAVAKLKLAGQILRETREEIGAYVREGMPIMDICEKAEDLIKKKGAKPAFPCNVSVNEIAAHYTSPPKDERRIPQGSVVKVDIGAHVDGYLTDTAVTVCFSSEHKSLVETAEHALKTAVNTIHAGITTSKLGSAIETTIRSRGFKPVSNLTGHQIGRYSVHTGTSVPNVSHLFSSKIHEGGVYAIEPFVTLPAAAGRVENGDISTIYRLVKPRSVKSQSAKELSRYIEENFRTLPFSERWLQGVVESEHYSEAFHELLASKSLMDYPIFVEATGKVVAQAEHTVLVEEDGCVVLT